MLHEEAWYARGLRTAQFCDPRAEELQGDISWDSYVMQDSAKWEHSWNFQKWQSEERWGEGMVGKARPCGFQGDTWILRKGTRRRHQKGFHPWQQPLRQGDSSSR